MKLYKDKVTGEKLYPVCKWEPNQHKLYNALDRAHNALNDLLEDDSADADAIEKAEEWIDEVQRLIQIFDSHVASNGVVVATYQDGQKIKDIIWAYNAR